MKLAAAIADAQARLAAAGVGSPRLDAELLFAHALARDRLWLLAHRDEDLAAHDQARAAALVERRCGREPLSHIVGRREFWSLDLAVDRHVLDPRPDSETLVAAVVARTKGTAPLLLVDLGVGSGALLLALLSELPAAFGLGLDRSMAALHVAQGNARRLGFAQRAGFLQGDWTAALAPGRYDLVVSNPPYIPSAEIGGLAPEVALFEPSLALDGGPDGLDAYRVLAGGAAALLRPGGLVALEVGAGQASSVQLLLAAAGLEPQGVERDLGGVERCVLARKKAIGSAMSAR